MNDTEIIVIIVISICIILLLVIGYFWLKDRKERDRQSNSYILFGHLTNENTLRRRGRKHRRRRFYSPLQSIREIKEEENDL